MNQTKKRQKHFTIMIIGLAMLFILLSGCLLSMGSRYISNNLLRANEASAIDIALLVKNNFTITDDEVAYMKGLSFNEMEVDAINYRLMNIGNGVELNAAVENVYIIAPLNDSEQKICETEEQSKLIGYEVGTVLNGMWMLNGTIDENGQFKVTQRDNICRYTVLTDRQKHALSTLTPCSEYSSDIWGRFITGYAPVCSTEGNVVGLIGIDVIPDIYQESAQKMIWLLILSFLAVTICLCAVFVVIYLKYIRAKKEAIYFDFYSRMSHDMRTPMSGILGMAAISKNENSVDALHRNFESVEAAGKYMLRLINDTLDIQAIKTGKMTLSPEYVNASKLVNELMELILPLAHQKGVEINVKNEGVKLECLCYVDEIRVKQIFMNMVSNAVKFTPKGGCVTFGMECLGADGNVNHNKFSISDTGIGMSEKFIKNRLFMPFEQESSGLIANQDGSGLGLYITKQLVEMMDGHIEVESKPKVGTTFSIYLDIITKEINPASTVNLQAESGFAKNEALDGKHILLFEDHPLNIKIEKILLEKKGCIVDVAENGAIGLEMFSNSETGFYNAILMDIRMPIMDGLEAAKRIRLLDRPDARTVPIIAMTANTYAEDISASKQAGMNAHLGKPIEPENLYRILSEHMSKN